MLRLTEKVYLQMQVLNNKMILKAFVFLMSILSPLMVKLRGFFLLMWRPNLSLLRLSRDLARLVVTGRIVTEKLTFGFIYVEYLDT